MFFSPIFLTSLFLGLAKARQASNFEVSPEVAEQYSCGHECQAALAMGNAADLEILGTDFDFDFYETAGNFSSSEPGDVLKLNPIDSSAISVPPGTSVYKMQYTSENVDGDPVPATAFLAFPFVQTSEPFQLVAFAHGTTGVFRGCPPSTSPSLYDRMSWTPLTLAGYAVVATDYAGLGNNYTTHQYISNVAHANDVVYSVMAAKSAFSKHLSKNWVSIGHSQGGSAVWKLSEHPLVQDEESGYLGGIAMAPAATKTHEQIQIGLDKVQNSTDPRDLMILSNLPGAYIAIKRYFPDYKATWLSEKVKQRIELGTISQVCIMATGSLIMDLTPDDMLTTYDVSDDKYMEEFQEINAAAQGDPASKPLLILHGMEDWTIPYYGSVSSFNETCNYGNLARLSLYPGLDHGGIVTGASPEWLGFIADRFAGVAFDGECTKSVVEPFNLKYAEKTLEM
ncbi:hypothetical protein FQN54_005453 [Arachnomyces sp. PD_36]|nr:hypothetical protein FQN54_005453 [Arachnomyces sp. PD_36]